MASVVLCHSGSTSGCQHWFLLPFASVVYVTESTSRAGDSTQRSELLGFLSERVSTPSSVLESPSTLTLLCWLGLSRSSFPHSIPHSAVLYIGSWKPFCDSAGACCCWSTVRVLSTRTPCFSSRAAFQPVSPQPVSPQGAPPTDVGLCSCSWVKLQMGLVFTVTKSIWMAAHHQAQQLFPPVWCHLQAQQHTLWPTQDKSLQYPSYSSTSLYDTLSTSFWLHPSNQSFLYHLALQQSVMSKSGYENIVGDRAENLAKV